MSSPNFIRQLEDDTSFSSTFIPLYEDPSQLFASNSTHQSGDLFHPAAQFSQGFGPALFSTSDLKSRFSTNDDFKPLYTPAEALQLALLVDQSGLCNAQGLKIDLQSHFNLPAWEFICHRYQQQDKWLLPAIRYGWPLGRDKTLPLSNTIWPNHGSALRHNKEVQDYLFKEVQFGAIFPLGPTPRNLPPACSTIPLLTVPKDITGRRICADASFPSGYSLNDSIPDGEFMGDEFHLRLPSIWDFLAQVIETGIDSALLSKLDWTRGYRQLSICPGDWIPQLLYVEPAGFLIDTKGMFGVKSMAAIQQRTHSGVTWAAHQLDVDIDFSLPLDKQRRASMPYIDDNLMVASASVASSFWENNLQVFSSLNVKLSTTPGHVSPPARQMKALGFNVDLDNNELSIPIEKIQELCVWLDFVGSKANLPRSDLKKLLGRIMRVSMVVSEGRKFSNRLLQLLRGPEQSGSVKLSDQARADIAWWRHVAPTINSRCLIVAPEALIDSVFVVDGRGYLADGSPPSIGGLCFPLKQFFSQELPSSMSKLPIHTVEAVALLGAARAWFHLLPQGQNYPVGSDSRPVVDSVMFGRAKDDSLAACTRLLWSIHAALGSSSRVVYVSSKENASDGLSRLQQSEVQKYKDLGWTQIFLSPAQLSLEELV